MCRHKVHGQTVGVAVRMVAVVSVRWEDDEQVMSLSKYGQEDCCKGFCSDMNERLTPDGYTSIGSQSRRCVSHTSGCGQHSWKT